MARRALGRGLNALISSDKKKSGQKNAADQGTEVEAGAAVELKLANIVTSPWQPRKNFDTEKLESLAQSIKEQGLVQPVVVRQKGKNYELIAGERRFRATQLLKRKTISAIIMEATDDKVRELALVENLQRDDLNPVEIATAYQALREELGLTHEQIGKRLGVSRALITNTLRLLELPGEVKGLVSTAQLSAGHARAILSLPESVSQIRMAKRAVKDGLSVRAVEKACNEGKSTHAKAASGNRKASPDRQKEPHLKDLEDRLRSHLGTKVSIVDKGGKGTIVIEYYTPEDTTRILEAMNVPGELA